MANITEPIVLNKTMEVGIRNITNKLESIAVAVGKSATATTWEQIQNVVQAGMGQYSYPIGTQFVVHHDIYGDITWDVVAHNYNTDSNGDVVPSMTLLTHDRITSQQYDSAESMYYAEEELPAGTYNFTCSGYSGWVAGTYQFTLTQPVPQGGYLHITNSSGSPVNASTALTDSYITSRNSQISDVKIESVKITSGSGGTSLGTTGVELNHPQRMSYGNNNWEQSAFRQFLNSDANAGFWTPTHKFDRRPDWHNTLKGFINGLDRDFVKVVGETKIGNRTNNVYEIGDNPKSSKYYTVDKFFLASQREIFGTTEGVDDGTIQFPYFVGSTNADRVKVLIGTSTAGGWWLRSPGVGYAGYTRRCYTSGALDYSGACSSYGAVPACVIY